MEFTQGVRFDSLGLLPEMTRALEKKNIEWSTPCRRAASRRCASGRT